jgi:tetratricopeptide (TPR) repeat protein
MVRRNKIINLGIALLFIVPSMKAQKTKVSSAYALLQRGQLDSAKTDINEAILHSETSQNEQTWYLRGFIYKSIYNNREKADRQSPARLEALISFRNSLSLDSTGRRKFENVKNIKYLATTLYNDAAESIDTVNYKIALKNFEAFREYYLLVDTSKQNLRQKEIEFGNAIAHVYSKLYDGGREDRAIFFDLAKASLSKVLELDPDNISANYSMAILYYNQAVSLINRTDYGIDIVSLSAIQDNSIELFKASLPFMEKAYTLDPNRKETLMGLSGIYFGLNESEKSDEFKNKLERMGK